MAVLLKTSSLSYDDVTLLAQLGVVDSRKEVPIEGNRIVVSAMTSIIGPAFIKAVASISHNWQPTLHIPRDEYKFENVNLCKKYNLKNIFIGVGLKEDIGFENHVLFLTNYRVAFIDIANGYLPQIKERVNQLKAKGFEKVICGSVHTKEGVEYLSNCDVDIIRTGIGTSSSICSTRYTTGFYRATISELLECCPYAYNERKLILADGGFKYVGDYAKAFLAGASYCMGGKLFTNCREARMHVDGTGEYVGMSNPVKGVSNSGFDESFSVKIPPPTKDLHDVIREIWDGLRSAVSYSGYNTLENAIGNGVFEQKIKL